MTRWMLLPFIFFACKENAGDEKKDDDFVRPPTDTADPNNNNGGNPGGMGDGTGTGDGATAIEGSINGVIDLELYTMDENGDRETLSWDDTYGEMYPYGKIFVTAYYEDPTSGAPIYVGYDVLNNPKATGNTYSIPITMNTYEELRVYAILDYRIDNVTGTDEPNGGYSRTVSLNDEGVENGVVNDVSFSIMTPIWEPPEECPNNNRTINVSGKATITKTWEGGDVAVIMMKPGNIGPVHHNIAFPQVLGGGAEAEYNLEVCENLDAMLLLGIWDENMNGMFDPMDAIGPYIKEENESGNPIYVAYSNMVDREIQIPMTSGSGLSLVPFVKLTGAVQPSSGSFDDLLPDGGTLYITALKYRPNLEVSVSDVMEDSYDYQVFTADQLSGQTEVDWKLVVPSETITYLWAYVDSDNDGILNEPQEPLASGGNDDNGKYPTGNQNSENIDLNLLVMEGGEPQ